MGKEAPRTKPKPNLTYSGEALKRLFGLAGDAAAGEDAGVIDFLQEQAV